MPEFKNVCGETMLEYIYKEKSLKEYSDYISFKEQDMNQIEFYTRIKKLDKIKADIKITDNEKNEILANRYCSDGKLLELKILFTKGIYPKTYGANLAAKHGHLEILKWMKENNLPLPSQLGANWAVEFAPIEVLQWLKENNIIPDELGSYRAVYVGRLDVLQWLEENNIYFTNQNDANTAAAYGHLDILQWMKDNNAPLPNQNGANWAAENGRLDVLEWLKNNNLPLPNSVGVTFATRRGHSNVLEWIRNNVSFS